MSRDKRTRWRRTSPLAAIFYLGRIFQAIAKNAVQSMAPLVAFLIASEGDILTRIGIGLAAFFAFIIAASIVRYWFFRFRVTDTSVLIRDGVFKKTQLDIKFDRIQAINTEQNVIYRAFDLVTLTFDTAGSAKQEGHLPAIKSELADSLKQRIRRERPAPLPDEDDAAAAPAIRPILALSNGDMVRIGLSSNRALLFLVLLGPVIDQLDQRIGNALDDTALDLMIDNAKLTLLGSATLAIAFVVVFLLLLILASIVGAFLRYHRFSLVADDDVLRSTGGLLTRHEHSVNLAKIQTLESMQNPMLRLFRRFRVRAKQASSGRQGRGKHFLIPLSTASHLPLLCNEVFGNEFDDAELLPGSTAFRPIALRYVRSRILLTGVLPALLVFSMLFPAAGLFALVFLLWIPLNALLVWTIYRKYGFIVTGDGVVLRSGLLGFRVTSFLHRKVQRVSVTQTHSQKRKGLATLRFYLASGSVKLPYIDATLAGQLRDFVLYRVESSQLAWH